MYPGMISSKLRWMVMLHLKRRVNLNKEGFRFWRVWVIM